MQTPPHTQKCPHQKVIVNGAHCSESNGKNDKKIRRFLFFELSSKIGVIFSEKWHKNDHNSKNKNWKNLKIGSSF